MVGARFPDCGGYFPPHFLGFRGLEDIPPGEFEPHSHVYRPGSPDTQSAHSQTGLESGEGSFNAGPFGIGGAEHGILFMPEALGSAPFSGCVVECAAGTTTFRGALFKARTDPAQRAVKNRAGLPARDSMNGLEGRMTRRTPANAFGVGVNVKIVHMQFVFVTAGLIDRADQFHPAFFTILDIGIAPVTTIAQHGFGSQSGFLENITDRSKRIHVRLGRRLGDRAWRLHLLS